MKRLIHAALNNKGSTVVEASIIMPVVILIVVALLYLPLVFFTGVHNQCAADIAAERGSIAWDNSHKEIASGYLDIGNLAGDGLYWRIYDSKSGLKARKAEEFAKQRLESFKLTGTIDREAWVDPPDNIFFRAVTSRTQQKLVLPLGGMLRVLGMPKSCVFTSAARSTVYEPAEFLRNIDFLADTERELEKSNPGLGNLSAKYTKTLGDIKDTIHKYFN